MSDWGAGYITDIPYMPGYYPQQSPWHLAVCGTLCGFDVAMPRPDDVLHYLELGCGLGLGAMMLAAGNPTWRITAIDFNPSHIAKARRMAAEAGLANIEFIEGDFSTLADDPVAMAAIPAADVVSMHGVWSWVAMPVRAGIVRLLKARVRSGGIVHLSYNTLPAWQGGIGLQRLVREVGERKPGRSDTQVAAGLAAAKALLEADAKHLRLSPLAAGMIDRLPKMAPEYLAHELMNRAWAPCFHADVAADLGEARLDWVGSAHITENFPELMLDEKQRTLRDEYNDPLLRELITDICVERTFRSDIFVRGAARISSVARDRALGGVTVGLAVDPDKFSYQMNVSVGQVTMNEAFYGAVVRKLAGGPCRLGELVSLPELDGHSRNPAELASMLIGSNQAEIVARPGEDAGPAARRINGVSARRYVDRSLPLDTIAAVASARLGGGLRCSALELFLLDRIAAVGGWIDPAAWVAEFNPDMSPDDAAELRGVMIKLAENRRPAWRLSGLA